MDTLQQIKHEMLNSDQIIRINLFKTVRLSETELDSILKAAYLSGTRASNADGGMKEGHLERFMGKQQ